MVVLHYTGMATADDALARLCDPMAEVSAHYLIDTTGRTLRLVPEEARAWHAGAGRWGAVTDVNSRSIGIELANPGHHPFPAPQMAALETLLSGILARHAIPPARVIAHSDMAPARKRDPGPRFDWRRLALSGLSVWPAPAPGPHAPLGESLARIGYDPALPPDLALAAFRLRFRPWASGPADATDAALAHDLAHRFPVDPPAVQA
jgi:N-acetylmuramoyl-L-alanine amidase